MRKLIILTPVKNEEWIISRFVDAVGTFADGIILLDQSSTDYTCEIASRSPKVVVVKNPLKHYDEADRQARLIAAARKSFGCGHLFLALDADELPTAESLDPIRWEFRHSLPPGTFLEFPKYEIVENSQNLDERIEYFTLGFIDDNRAPRGSFIHSQRLPKGSADISIRVPSINFIHLARARTFEYQARQSYYNLLEVLAGSKSWRTRALYYSPTLRRARGKIAGRPIPKAWLNYKKPGPLDLGNLPTERNNRFSLECRKIVMEHGYRRFVWEDVWDYDSCLLDVEDKQSHSKLQKATRAHYRIPRRIAFRTLGYLALLKGFLLSRRCK